MEVIKLDPRPEPPWGPDFDPGPRTRVRLPRTLLHAPAFAELAPAERWVQIRLIVASWAETPRGSVPSSPASLADLAGFGLDVDAWHQMAPRVLSFWTAARDDRLYFEPLAESTGSQRNRKDTK